jgi:hypothetical protein
MTEEKRVSPAGRFRWRTFIVVVGIIVLCLLAIYFFVYLRVGG